MNGIEEHFFTVTAPVTGGFAGDLEELMTDYAQLLEEYIALPLTLWFNKESIEDMLVLKMKNDFVWDLANRNYGSFLEMVRQGSRLGFDLSASHICVALRICARDPQQVLDEYSASSAALVSAMTQE